MRAYQEKGYPVAVQPAAALVEQGQSVTVTYPEVGEHLRAPTTQEQRPYCCPICKGATLVPAYLYQWPKSDTTTDLSPVPCKSCLGTGLVWR